ncbi:MAG: VOC family protein, partial [Haliea sp.]
MLAARHSQPRAKSLDHFVLLVRDADAAAAVYERLGFHVRPLAEHKDIGSRNRVVHFDQTYLEFIDMAGAREDVACPYLDRFQIGEGLVHVS